MEFQPKRTRQGVRHCGFAYPRQIFNKQVAARQYAGKRQTDLPVLAENDTANLGNDPVYRLCFDILLQQMWLHG